MDGTIRMKRLSGTLACLALSLFAIASLPAAAQVVAKPPVATPSTGGNSFDGPGDVRYQSERDSQDRRIDMFMGDWRDSMPRHVFGSLVLRDILTRGDNYAPPQPGAILQAANYLAYGRLQPRDSTVPTTLDHEQIVYYFIGRQRRDRSRRQDRPGSSRRSRLHARQSGIRDQEHQRPGAQDVRRQ